MVKAINIRSRIARNFLDMNMVKEHGYKIMLSNFLIHDADYIIAGGEHYNDNMLNGSNIKLISRCGHGTDNIDVSNVRVMDCRGTLDDVVAECVLGYMIMCNRGLLGYDRNCRNNIWDVEYGDTLFGSTIGIIGMGGIGNRLSSLLKMFDVKLLYHDIIPSQCNCRLDDLLASSDIVTLHCDLNDLSRNMIGEDELARMKQNSILINTSRGGILDEDALYKYHEKFKYIVLDVFRFEPVKNDSRLFSCRNIIFGTHSAGWVERYHRAMAFKSFKNILDYEKEMGMT